MEKDWYSIDELALRWHMSQDDIERYLQTGTLKAVVWLRTPSTLFLNGKRVQERGIFNILNYNVITWECSGGINNKSQCDFAKETVRLSRENSEFVFAASKHIDRDDVLITSEEVKRFESL